MSASSSPEGRPRPPADRGAARSRGVVGDPATAGGEQPAQAARLLAIAGGLAAEIHPDRAGIPVLLDARVAEDLGLDSVAVVELRSRVEESFGVVLPDNVVGAAVLREWLDALEASPGSGAPPGPFGPAVSQAPALSPAASATGVRRVPGPDVAAGLPSEAETLADALWWHASVHPDRTHIRLLSYGGEQVFQQNISYGGLLAGAQAVAAGLRAGGLGPGERVAIMLPTGRDYFTAFTGAMLAGGVAVPLYPPARLAGLEEHLRRQAGILGNAQAAALIAFPEIRRVARLLQAQVPSLRTVATAGELHSPGETGALPKMTAGDTALLQYTSGSTGAPKGVILTHRHLLANIRAMGDAADAGPSDVFVSWLPLYHDMGLIGAWLAALYHGFVLVVMSPLAFLGRPARWLRAISDHHGTLSGAPNFAYELCLRKVPDSELPGLDLSSWRLAFDGSETVAPATLRRFSQRFAACGLRPQAMAPAYGLAEAGVAVTFPPPGRGPLIDVIDRGTLPRSGRAVRAGPGGPAPQEVVSCGRPLPGYQVRVLDRSGRQLPERREGQIEFTGPSATPGYFRNEPATRALRHGIWARTGDLGYLADGELYVTGRDKDVIIRRGRNLHPDELEAAVGNLAGVEPGGVAVFGCPSPAEGTERLIVAAETHLNEDGTLGALRADITAVSVGLLGVTPDEVVFAPPGGIPKTASGKIRRAATADRYQAGTLTQPSRGARWQVTRFALSGLPARLGKIARLAGALLYAGWAWLATVAVAVPAWLLVISLPSLRARWDVVRAAGQALRRLLAVPLTVTGRAPATGPFVIVANHASFTDGLILAACLPEPVCFAAAGRFATSPLTGPFLRRLGCEFVYRAGPATATAQALRLASVLRQGRSLAIWPEGGIDPAAGLRPFHLGAFDAAVSAGVPVIPAGIRGSRELLRTGTKFPRRCAINVAFGSTLHPTGTGWAAVLALRDQARKAVLALSEESDLSQRLA